MREHGPTGEVPDAVVRVVATSGREAVHEPLDPGRIVDAASVRIVAAALVGGDVDQRALERACDAFAADPDGVDRITAMVRRAMRVLVHDTSAGDDDSRRSSGEHVPIERAARVASVHGAVLRAVARRQDSNDAAYEKFSAAVTDVAESGSFEDACRRAADALVQLSGMPVAGVYVPGAEHARMVRAARSGEALVDQDDADDGSPAQARSSSSSAQASSIAMPGAIRVDRGLFADVVAGERPVYVSGRDRIDAVPAEFDVRTLVAVPMRDRIGRPVGMLIALDDRTRELDVSAIESIRRLAGVVAGELGTAAAMRRSRAALGTLPELAEVAHADDSDVTNQLEALARIVARATDSDSAVIRVRDAAGRYLETRAVVSSHGDAVADAVGTRTQLVDERGDGSTSRKAIGQRLREAGMRGGADVEMGSSGRQHPLMAMRPDLDHSEIGMGEHELVGLDEPPATWSKQGQRILRELSARTVASFPIDSRYGRQAVIYVVRTTARPFDDVDRACIRIATAHAQHVVDRHVSQQQTARAIDAARSAVRLLGEALVAGVRTDRTLRFLPRLYHEMFAGQGVRVWRRDRNEAVSLVAAAGSFDSGDGPAASASTALLGAFERPLQLELDTSRTPHVAAITFNGYGDVRIGVEMQVIEGRSLGVEEQRLAVDVASRIQEALYSAGQAAAQQVQLDRVRSLQQVVTTCHERLGEQHVVDTIIDQLPDLYRARGAAVFLVDDDGALACRGVLDLPPAVVEGLEGTRGWVPDATGDERAAVVAVERAGSDERLGERLREIATSEGLADHAVAIVPLTGHEQTLGLVLLTFVDGLPDDFIDEATTGRTGMLGSFGRQVGAALLNSRTFERERMLRDRTQQLLDVERENARQVRALHEVSRAFANSLSFEETLAAAAEAMADRLDVDAVWIRTLDDRGEHMLLRAFHAGYPELAGALERMVAPPESREDPITVEVMQSRRAVLVTDPDDEEWSRSELLRRLRPFLQRGSTLAVLPMMRPGSATEDVMGTLVMLAIDPTHALTYDKVDVATSVTDQAALALDNARLYQQQKSFAEIIQESLLPRRLPDVPEIDYGVIYRSAVVGGDAPQIGGDFYDFLELEDGRLAMALGDVTGKGVQAAADTAMTKYAFRSLAREHPDPASFLRYVNDVVCDEISPGKFVTLFYAVIDPVRGTFTCGNAGHPEPKLLFPGGTELADGTIVDEHDPKITSIGMEGLALGILQDQDYEQKEYAFPPGAALVVYTDGVVEARREGRLYGQFRLERRIMEEAGAGAGQIAYSIYEDCHAYAEHGLNDDVAIVVVRHIP
ncbi:MAG: SpoIIE family protein phosphatase [Thermoleophilia bacterium]|nr:SpoIIE family protein phosphatase [Thermoleophilia bacterium]